jgi:hypothetical protein
MTLVFCKGEWRQIQMPAGSSYSFADSLAYANLWAHAVYEKGVKEGIATQLAEAAVFKRLYPGVKFHTGLEEKLLEITR